MRKHEHEDTGHEALPNLTPFIEVCLVVIAALVVGLAGEAARERLDVTLAKAQSAQQAPRQERLLRVQITGDGAIRVFGKPRTLDEVKAIITERKDRLIALLETDDAAKSGQLIAVVKLCNDVGMTCRVAERQPR